MQSWDMKNGRQISDRLSCGVTFVSLPKPKTEHKSTGLYSNEKLIRYYSNSSIIISCTRPRKFSFNTFSKLRNNFDLQDLGFRFCVTKQIAVVIFNSWVNNMFLRFGEVSIWPHWDSGFKTTLSNLIDNSHLERWDGFMADKGFNIEHEVDSTGLKLNIPQLLNQGHK
ncbi:hypothetical protein KUTeg_024897 [Tegillarca granosa]|uniref:DDE Tnp4 domain-containing protein n=1 Tax=Tegillarca granosa TaxID=220873 RepID=A0ABQ9E1S2_TEGGR|nr:hypothetical protein KUTeg_024897 [Tegillarca granosa]